MATQILKMFADGSAALDDATYNAMEAETRSVLITMFVQPECKLAFSKASEEQNHPTEDRAYIELWAWIDFDNGNDFVTWNITTTEGHGKYPITYCPFCGLDLQDTFLYETV